MTKICKLNPELFKDLALSKAEQTYQLPLRLALIGLGTCTDRDGCFEWRPRRLKLDVLPYDDLSFESVLDALQEIGVIEKYQDGEKFYGCLRDVNHTGGHLHA